MVCQTEWHLKFPHDDQNFTSQNRIGELLILSAPSATRVITILPAHPRVQGEHDTDKRQGRHADIYG
ncbi:MAG: hypothetical protein OXH47_07470 [Paracoccaceae bacterium]|nr:hypothetical protein [Paracoccaceae bacterium]